MANKENKTKQKHNTKLEGRKVLRVPFFEDEFQTLGLDKSMGYYDAVAVVRSKTGCVIGARTRLAGVSKSALYKQFDTATEEQKKAISAILGAN